MMKEHDMAIMILGFSPRHLLLATCISANAVMVFKCVTKLNRSFCLLSRRGTQDLSLWIAKVLALEL